MDTCTGDVFQPTCPNSRDTLLMLSATYGRMEIGKCITKKEVGMLVQDSKYFGCSSDVLRFLHYKCSLKQSCDLKIPDDDLDTTEPCFPGLKLYLHTEYRCIKGEGLRKLATLDKNVIILKKIDCHSYRPRTKLSSACSINTAIFDNNYNT